MIIRDMFAEDINRKINGVIKVDQSAEDVLEQEVKEYVITRELKKHFTTFFDNYSDAFDEPTSDIGVWISGFFGSGKSHFLKMLSYILENKNIGGIPTVEYFRKKFEDDPGTFMLIDKATKGPTETILFNIDIEGPINKDKTAVLRVFAKMFYNHLGFYGEELKVAKLEQYIDSLGKTEEFRRVFEEKKGKPWVEQRKVFAFNGKYIIPTMMEVLDMSEEDASSWFHDKSAVDYSIAELVKDIKYYVDSKPDNFRLLFMVDEVGQYVGTDTDMLLNLQSLVEKIGSDCGGKVWVVCTGQEAIDEIIKVRADEFSRIQARFRTRLSLSSSSVDEVIQKRILKKTPEAEQALEQDYDGNAAVLRNLITFTDSVLDIKGFSGPAEFATDFPFIPYQFILMQKVFAEIRKHGNSGKHLSGGERSMLSGFQEAAQKVQEKDENTLVPFYMFYDTVHTFLESGIRRVIERCQKAADNGDGIEQIDVNVLKLLYLIRYIDDVKANIDNIIVLMADNIQMDKITMKEKIRGSLDRLQSQNYIGRTGDTYNFLTDEEQEIALDIKRTSVDTATIVSHISNIIFSDIYASKKYRYGKYDFEFDQMVDSFASGKITGGMRLHFLTVATDPTEKNELHLMTESKGKENRDKEAIVVLADTPYFESLENAMKIRKYVKQQNVMQLSKKVQDIIRGQQDEAARYEQTAREELKQAIVDADFYIVGEHVEINGGDAKSKIDQALEYLVSHVYSDLSLINKNMDSDADILAILNGSNRAMKYELEPNYDAAVRMEEYLDMQAQRKLPTSMADVQSRYNGIPYGWREIDIAAVAALLISYQKVTIKYAGATIQPEDSKLPDMLRKKSEVGKVSISKRVAVTASKIREVKDFLGDYFDVMDVPSDEDHLVKYIGDQFTEQKDHYLSLDERYNGHNYPDHPLVKKAISLMEDILSQKKDNIALINRVIEKEDDLEDNREDMNRVEDFFKTQVNIFDAAVQFEKEIRNDLDYLRDNEDANQALDQIRLITMVHPDQEYDYTQIPELNGLMQKVKQIHDSLLADKRKDLLNVVTECMGEIHTKADDNAEARQVSDTADSYYTDRKKKIAETQTLALLDGMVPNMWNYRDDTVEKIDHIINPPEPPKTPKPAAGGGNKPTPPKKVVKPYYRQAIFPSKVLESEEDIDAYLEDARKKLEQLMKDCDGIKLN